MSIAKDREIFQNESDAGSIEDIPVGRRALGTKIDAAFIWNTNCLSKYSGKQKKIFNNLIRGSIWLLWIAPSTAFAAPLSHDDFLKLATQCAPVSSLAILEAVARTESDLDPWILHDNTMGQMYAPETLSNAITTLKQWVNRGDSVDIGLMQINSENLDALGITASMALDPCVSLASGATILRAAYGGAGDTPAEQQVALLMALSRYNTGSPFKGIMNGYARTVMNNAGMAMPLKLPWKKPMIPQVDQNEAPTWNVSATGTYAQTHGASWLVVLEPIPAQNADFVTPK